VLGWGGGKGKGEGEGPEGGIQQWQEEGRVQTKEWSRVFYDHHAAHLWQVDVDSSPGCPPGFPVIDHLFGVVLFELKR